MRAFIHPSSVLAVFVSCLSSCDAARPKDPVSAEIKSVTESPARVVWCQDLGDGTDLLAEGRRFRLMGFDTEDRRGERVILSRASSYVRPLFTPLGDRIVFSDRQELKMFLVNWDGSGLRELGEGFAVDTWLDPRDGSEWLYFFGDPVAGVPQDQRGYSGVMKCRIDHPSKKELVWNRTDVMQLTENNFQVSADGTRASLVGPVMLGVAELPNVGWERVGKGCWPSLAPDNSYRFWHFDGGHRSLTIYDSGALNPRRVAINQAPGVEGREVFHPRWSNHPRFMTMTGPLKIAGGGPAVEIYIGRFDPAFTNIEKWAHVTHNERADFFPDLWIASGMALETEPARKAAAPAAAVTGAWPSRTDGLVFLWRNRAADNEIMDASGRSNRVCRAEPRGLARYGRRLEMDLTGGAFIAEAGNDELWNACRNSNELTIEATITPKTGMQTGPTRIVSFASGTNASNFMLGQEQGELIFDLATGEGPGPLRRLCGLRADTRQHVVVSYKPGLLVCYLDGSLVFSNADVKGVLAGWTPAYLVFGDAREGGWNWSGTLEGVAIYSRYVDAIEARRNAQLYASMLKGQKPAPRLVVDAQLVEASNIPAPEAILPYRRGLVVNRYEILHVIEGQFDGKELLAAHWAILDAKKMNGAERKKDKVYRMTLEAFDDHPELEGERLMMDGDEFLLPLFYNVGR
jgi:hypothetical protein